MKNIFKILIIYFGILFGQTEEQIKKAKEIIDRTGMTENQVKNAARARGYTEKEIESAIQKGKSMDDKENNSIYQQDRNFNLPEISNPNRLRENEQVMEIEKNNEGEDFSITDANNSKSVNDTDFNFVGKAQPNQKKVRHFGYDIFARDPAFFQATSVGAVDPDYLIGPGDDIIVMLWGETQFRQELTVDREGFVFIPEIGQVFVNGLNLNLLESKLFRVFSQSYASLNPQSGTPTTFLDVSLGNLRPLRIQVLGEVDQPGAYVLSPSATLFSSLYYFNGPTTLGTLRDIQLIRAGENIASIDFYDYLLTGKKPRDEKLQLDDIIFIPRRLKTVTIEGEVNRSGIFELKPDESFGDLLTLAGDLKITAYLKRAQIDRIVSFEKRSELGMDRMYNDVNLENLLKSKDKFLLQDGDHIQIFSVMDNRSNVVELQGAVSRPGSYDLGEAMKLSELINKADGLLGDAYLKRVDVIRINQNLTEELIKLNLEQALNGDELNDINLKGSDRIRVYSLTEMIPKTYVSITGHVKRPGKYLRHENMMLYDLIFKAGGFLDEEFKKLAFLDRADLVRLDKDGINTKIYPFNLGGLLESQDSELNVKLKPNDLVRIYKKDIFISNNTVSINGIVRQEGNYNLKKGMTLKDLILEAGGLDNSAYRYRAEIARINPSNSSLETYAELFTFDIDEKSNLSKQSSGITFGTVFSPEIEQFQLSPYDLVSIRPDPYFINQKQVSISGEVLYPGNYTILSSEEKITDIIDRSGGLRANAYPESSQYFRRGVKINVSLGDVLKNPKSRQNFKVQDGDEIKIFSHPNVIKISGEVNTNGIHKYVPGKRLRYYINLAGGFNPEADKSNIWVEYPSGDSKKYSRWSFISPKIIDGSSIVVGKQKEKEPFDQTEFAKEVTTIIANLAQAIAVLVLAGR